MRERADRRHEIISEFKNHEVERGSRKSREKKGFMNIAMDIYDSRYFAINKTLQSSLGLWPYQNAREKFYKRICVLMVLAITFIPQVLSIHKNFGVDIDSVLENLGLFTYLNGVALKVSTGIYIDKKLKFLYDAVAKNWQIVTDETERNILIKYSERGRQITLVYITYMTSALICFVTMPLTPIMMDMFIPLNTSRKRIFILNGEFTVDRDYHYGKIYIFDTLACIITVFLLCASDSMYAVCVEHCLGLFSIVKYRLRTSIKMNSKGYTANDVSYKLIVQTIQFHKEIIKFTNTIESSYNMSFLFLVGMTLLIISIDSVLVIIKLEDTMECIRYCFILMGQMIHLFYISWPGQKVIDHSADLFVDTYLNEWYERSLKTQHLLKFMTLRCMRPCQLTAGGLYVMNFENFASILKKSTSYMTLLASFR